MADEIIGSVGVEARLDYSDLGADFEAAVALAVSTGATLADAIQAALVTPDSTGVTEAFTQVGAAAGVAAEQLSLFGAAEDSIPFANAAGQLNLFATELESFVGTAQQVPSAGDAAAEAVHAFAQESQQAGEKTHEASSGIQDLRGKLLELSEALIVTEGLREFGTEAIHASDMVARATISLTALTGSAEIATETIAQLEEVAKGDALSFPALLTASQRMVTFLDTSEGVVENLKHIADGAAAAQTDISTAATAFDRLATGAAISSRTLMPLGLTLRAVGEALHVTSGEAAAAFKALDQEQRIEVLNQALGKFEGLAEKAATTIGGQWKTLGVEWEAILRQIGDALTPVISDILRFISTDIVPFLHSVTEAFHDLSEPTQKTIVIIGLLTAAIVPAIGGLAALALAVDGVTHVLPLVNELLVSLGISSTAAAAGEHAAAAGAVELEAATAGLGAAFSLVLVSGLAAAVLGFHDLNEAMAATVAKEKETDAAFQKWIAQMVSAAKTDAEISEAETKVKAALDAGAISKDLAVKLLDQLGKSAKALVGTDLSAWEKSAGISLTVLSDATGKLTPTIQSVIDAQAKLSKGVKDAQIAYDTLSNAYKTGTPLANGYVVTSDDVKRALANLAAATKAAATETQIHADKTHGAIIAHRAMQPAVEILVETLKQEEAIYKRGIETAATYNRTMSELTGGTFKQISASELAQKKADAFQEAIGRISAGDPANMWEKGFVAPLQDVGPLIQKTGKEMNVLGDETNRAMRAALDTSPYSKLGEAFKLLGLTGINAFDGVENKALIAFETIAKDATTTLPEVQAAWAAVSGKVNHLAQSDIPAAIRMQDEYLQALQRTGAGVGQVMAEEEKLLRLRIQMHTQQGQSSNAEIIALTNIQMRTKALDTQTNFLGDTYKALMKDFDQAFTTLGNNIAEGIMEGKSFADFWHTTLHSIEKQLLTTVISAVLKLAESWIITAVTGKTASATQAAAAAAAAASQVAGIATVTAASATSAAAQIAGYASVTAAATASSAAQIAGYTAIGAAAAAEGIAAALAAATAGFAEVMTSAAVGAAAAAASTAAIPIVGPFLAPAAAASMYAFIASFAPLTLLEKGGIVPEDMLAMVHKNEMVLPADIATSLRGMIAAGGAPGEARSVSNPVVININSPRIGLGMSPGEVSRIFQEGINQARTAGAFRIGVFPT